MLKGSHTNFLRLLAILLIPLLAACSQGGGQEAPSGPPLEGTVWELESVQLGEERVEIQPDWQPGTLYLEDGGLTGRGPCNHYGGAYRIEGDTLSVPDGLMTTLMSCGPERDELEGNIFNILSAAPSFSIENQRLTLESAEGKLVFSAQPEARSDEGAVLSALLREWVANEAAQIIVREESAYNSGGLSLDETLQSVEAGFAAFGEQTLAPDEAILAAFGEANRQPSGLERVLPEALPVTLISQETLDETFSASEAQGWQAFHERYPGANGVFTLSRVGFSQDGDRALAYLGLHTENDNGSYYAYMVYSQGIWNEVTSFRLEP